MKGFTLTELLMSMGIISLLVGISIPALGRARESGRNASCQGNLRNWGIAYNLAHKELTINSKPYRRWTSPQEMLGELMNSAPPSVMIGGTAYEKKKPWWCVSDNRESRGVNFHGGISYYPGTFLRIYQGGIRNEIIREQDPARESISFDVENFHSGSRNQVYSDGSVGRGARREGYNNR